MTRRSVLAHLGALTAVAGCTASQESSSPRAVCEVGIGSNPGAVFALTPQVQTVAPSDDPVVELVVPVRQATVESENVARLVVYSGDDVLHQIPTNPDDTPVGPTDRYDSDDVVEYGQAVGHLPQTGIYRVVAVNDAGTQIDDIRVEFRCYRETADDSDNQ